VIYRKPEFDPIAADFQLPLILSTTPERVERARQTHHEVARRLLTLFIVLALVIMVLAIFLAGSGRGSLIGSAIVAAIFVAFGLFTARSVHKSELRARAYLASDGVTLLRIDRQGLRVGDHFIPHERITCIYGIWGDEQYSGVGGTGVGEAERVSATLAAQQRRRLYREGAAHTSSIIVGIDEAASLPAAREIMDPVRGVPQKGIDAARICMPFDAYLEREAMVPLLAVAREASAGRHPVGIVSGTIDTARAQTAPASTRQDIWSEAKEIMIAI